MKKKCKQNKHGLLANAHVKTLLYISSILYPNYKSYVFPLYMYILYCQTRVKNKHFSVKPIPERLLNELIQNHTDCDSYYDVNNAIVVNKKYLEFLGINSCCNVVIRGKNAQIIRLVSVYGGDLPQKVVLLSENLLHNLSFDENNCKFYVKPTLNQFKLASELNLSLVHTQYDIVNAVSDVLLKNYFKSPKIVYKNDVLVVNMRVYGQEFFFSNHKMNEIENVYFKVRSVKNGGELPGGVCLFGETTFRQSANVQSFLPCTKLISITKKVNKIDDFDDSILEICPAGLKSCLNELQQSVLPFLEDKDIKIRPVFLLRGSKGSGKNILLQSLALKLGLNLYKVTSNDFSALSYAQMEVKLKNVLFKARLCAPCILVVNNFENFGKNNEGQHDQRIITFFKEELFNFFALKTYPVILFCVSNAKEIPADLSRIFLESFEVNSPNQKERFEILSWIVRSKNISSNFDLNEIANKSHGFLYEDLEALVFYAERNWFSKFGSNNKNLDMVLRLDDFSTALDIMQNSYTDSLGAPKVPKVEWSDVGGLSDVKQEIIRTINLPLQHPELLKATGLKRSGILLYGPPGTGKTLLAKAVATECGLCFLSVKGPELLNMYVGQSEQNVREVFEKARQAAPCIIFFDELDSLAPNRGVSGDSGGVMDRVVSQLLAEMDGLNQSGTLFIIGATNRPDLIDPALLRPGRFDKLLYVGPCTDDQSKLSVLTALTRKFVFDRNVKLDEIVKSCPKNITGADFYGLCSNAWTSAARKLIEKIEKGVVKNKEELSEKDVVVSTSDFQEAIKIVKPSISPEDLLYFEKLKVELSVKK